MRCAWESVCSVTAGLQVGSHPESSVITSERLCSVRGANTPCCCSGGSCATAGLVSSRLVFWFKAQLFFGQKGQVEIAAKADRGYKGGWHGSCSSQTGLWFAAWEDRCRHTSWSLCRSATYVGRRGWSGRRNVIIVQKSHKMLPEKVVPDTPKHLIIVPVTLPWQLLPLI